MSKASKLALKDHEIEAALENLFGIEDGTVSEDDEEKSDEEVESTNLHGILLGEDVLLSSTAQKRQESPCSLSDSRSSRTQLSASGSVQETPPLLFGRFDSPVLSQSSPSRAVHGAPLDLERSDTPSLLHQPTTSGVVRESPSFEPQLPNVLAGDGGIPDDISDFSLSDDESDNDEIDWKKQNWQQSPDLESFDTVNLRSSRHLPNRTRPIAYFSLFFDEEVINNIVEQTNRYAVQINALNWKAITVNELKAFIGIIIQMGIHKLPTIEDYWSSDPLLHVVEIAETMTLQRFQKILKCLHVNDNSTMPSRNDVNYDKLYKVRPLIQSLNSLCQKNATTTNSQSIDECMIKFKGRSSLKQYMPMKPIKRGYKVWCRADSETGYLYQFQIYTGKTDATEIGLGSTVVKSLSEPLITKGYSGHVAFDNFFSSVDLLQNLYNEGIYSTATIRNDRIDLPLLVKKPKQTGNHQEDERISKAAKRASDRVKKLKRGKWKWRVKRNVGFAVWKDTKQVSIVSTAFHPKERKTCTRTQKDATKKTIKCPLIIPEYTKRMGGVDRFDQKRAQYSVGRRSRKWWKRIFYFLIDVAITNAYLLYKTNSRVHNIMSQKEFRISLSRELVDNLTFRKRPFKSVPNFVSKKKKAQESTALQKMVFGVPEEIRFQRLGEHWPTEEDTYKRCRYCSTKEKNKRSKISCSRCKVALCITPCFKQFHEPQV